MSSGLSFPESTLFRFLYLVSFNATPTPDLYTLSLHDALPISSCRNSQGERALPLAAPDRGWRELGDRHPRSEEHTPELQSRGHLVCRLLLEQKRLHANRRRAENYRL